MGYLGKQSHGLGKNEEIEQTDSQEKRKERIDRADKGGY